MVIFANALTEGGPITVRYAYPCFGMIIIWIAYFLEKLKRKSLIAFLILFLAWTGFQGLNNYRFLAESGMIKGLTSVKKPFPLESAMDFLKTKNTQFIYTDYYTAIQAQLVENNQILVTSKNPRTWGRMSRKTPDSLANFAIIFNAININADEKKYLEDDLYNFSEPSEKIIAARIKYIQNHPYPKFLDDNNIPYKIEKHGPHYVIWDIQANKEQFSRNV